MKNLLSLFTLVLLSSFTYGQFAIDVQAKGAANSTWLLNKNISDKGATQDYAAAWGSSYGVAGNIYFGMTGLGVEFLYSTHNAAYTGAYSVNDVSTGSYTSNVKLQTIQIPLLLKFQSEKGAYIELGPQLTNISSAYFERSGELLGISFYEGSPTYDISEEYYASSYISGVLGFGSKIAFGDLPLGMLLGIRLQYSFGDLMGVDGEGNSLGSEEDPGFWHPTHEPTQAVSGGLVIGLTYTIK
tara:strand:+ start:734 stop:1459 length:726 start_codon:yes stop_codon:yes gene_type:complete